MTGPPRAAPDRAADGRHGRAGELLAPGREADDAAAVPGESAVGENRIAATSAACAVRTSGGPRSGTRPTRPLGRPGVRGAGWTGRPGFQVRKVTVTSARRRARRPRRVGVDATGQVDSDHRRGRGARQPGQVAYGSRRPPWPPMPSIPSRTTATRRMAVSTAGSALVTTRPPEARSAAAPPSCGRDPQRPRARPPPPGQGRGGVRVVAVSPLPRARPPAIHRPPESSRTPRRVRPPRAHQRPGGRRPSARLRPPDHGYIWASHMGNTVLGPVKPGLSGWRWLRGGLWIRFGLC